MTDSESRETAARLSPDAKRKRHPLRQTPLMLTEADRAVLDALADETGRSRSALMREAVRRVWMRGERP